MKRFLMGMLALILTGLISYCTNDSIKDDKLSKISLDCFKNITIEEPNILGITKKNGLGIPNSTLTYKVSEKSFNITGYSSDPEYSYNLKKPIFTGGHFLSGSGRQWLFLSSLLDHKGNRIYFERLGSAGYYKDPAGKKSGIVDVYYIRIKELKKPIVMYLSLYGPTNTPIQIPKCFSYKEYQNKSISNIALK
ncbi:MAG: hypothetical protein OEV44_04460 [Spirochaetota bacterium]|nr:hypothetical protein [Spirochaetota bacterium]